MKIAYFHYLTDDDSALLHVAQFAAAVRSLGHTVTVHAMNLAPRGMSLTVRVRGSIKRAASPFLHEIKELLWNPRYVRRELAVVRREQPDVLLYRTHGLTASCLPVSLLTRKPYVLEMNAPASERAFYAQYFRIPLVAEALEGRVVRAAAEVLTVSGALRGYVAGRYGVSPDRVTVNHNGVDPEAFDSARDGAVLRASLGSPGRPVIGFIGSLFQWRGPRFLLDIIRSVSEEHDVRFLLVGDGDEWKPFREEIKKQNLVNRVILTGRLEHRVMPEYLKLMDVALVPDSAFYMSPLKLFEYMAAGVPTVAPAYPAIGEIIADGKSGLLFPPGDCAGAVRCIEMLLGNPEMRRSIGRASARTVAERYTWVHNAGRALSACARALERNGSDATSERAGGAGRAVAGLGGPGRSAAADETV
jgi:glycosyltransferase involved in cell wall biosynthesis